jgi:hypothetical protein
MIAMWKLTVTQTVAKGSVVLVKDVEFHDENPNNLLDLVRYLNECKTHNPTKYSIEPCEEVQ